MKKTVATALFILTVLVMPIQAADESKITMAIPDFEGQNISSSDARVISDFFRNAVVNTDLFGIVSRNDMKVILGEQKFQISGLTDQSGKVTQIGKLLNAQKVIAGSVTEFDKEYYINAKVIDVETGEIQYSERVRSGSKSQLPHKAESLALLISEKIYKKKPTIQEILSRRKKYAVYAFGITPLLYVPAATDVYTRGGFWENSSNSGTALAPFNVGAGIRFYPWKSICVDISWINDYSQDIEYNYTDHGNPGNTTVQMFEKNNLMFGLGYLFNPDGKVSYLVGGGIINTMIEIPFISSRMGNIAFVQAEADWKPMDNINISLAALSFINKFPPLSQYNGQKGEEIELVKTSPIVFKLAIAYNFNL